MYIIRNNFRIYVMAIDDNRVARRRLPAWTRCVNEGDSMYVPAIRIGDPDRLEIDVIPSRLPPRL